MALPGRVGKGQTVRSPAGSFRVYACSQADTSAYRKAPRVASSTERIRVELPTNFHHPPTWSGGPGRQEPKDPPMTLIAAEVVLGGTLILTCLVPAIRAKAKSLAARLREKREQRKDRRGEPQPADITGDRQPVKVLSSGACSRSDASLGSIAGHLGEIPLKPWLQSQQSRRIVGNQCGPVNVGCLSRFGRGMPQLPGRLLIAEVFRQSAGDRTPKCVRRDFLRDTCRPERHLQVVSKV